MKLLFAVLSLVSFWEVKADRLTPDERNAIIDGLNSLVVTMETISNNVELIKDVLIGEDGEEEELTPLSCPPLEPNDEAIVEYTNSGASVRCEATGAVWFLTCEGNEWIGDMQSCTSDPLTIGSALLRLVGTSTRGRLEVFHNDQWGTVCDDDFTDEYAAVICKSLGLPFENAEEIHDFGGGIGKDILLDDVNCASASDARFCTHRGWGVHNCAHSEDLGISCA